MSLPQSFKNVLESTLQSSLRDQNAQMETKGFQKVLDVTRRKTAVTVQMRIRKFAKEMIIMTFYLLPWLISDWDSLHLCPLCGF